MLTRKQKIMIGVSVVVIIIVIAVIVFLVKRFEPFSVSVSQPKLNQSNDVSTNFDGVLPQMNSLMLNQSNDVETSGVDNVTEKFNSVFPRMDTIPNTPQSYQQGEIMPIEPPAIDEETAIIQTGTKFIQQKEYYTPWGSMKMIGEIANADGSDAPYDNTLNDYSMNFNQCSPACCSDQWPVPFKMPVSKLLCENDEDFVPTSYYCNNGWQDSGCLCMTKDQSDFLQTRGLNANY